jgi:hypothetical protein
VKKQTYLPLVITTMVIALLGFNPGHDPAFSGICYAQEVDRVKEQIFKEVEEALQKAEAEDVILLSPNSFARANESYQEALQDYEAGEGLQKIRGNLDRAMEYINTALGKARFSRTVLQDLIQARKEARAVEIPERAEYIFSKAESMFSEAAMKVEDGDLEGAKSIAKDAEREYRATVIEGLRKFVLADARRKLKNMERTIPEQSYQKAEAELDKTEAFIVGEEPTEFAVAKLIGEIDTRIQQALTLASVKPPDLMIEGLILSPGKPQVGKEVVIRASVKNAGDQPAEGIVVLFLTQGGREIGRATIQHLEPTQTEAANITATVPELDQYLITVRVDPENLIAESNERNNEARQSFVVEPSSGIKVAGGAGIWGYILSFIVAFLLGSAVTFFAAKPRKKVKEREYRGPSEYQQLMDELTTILQGAKLADLAEEDITSLATKAKIDPRKIAYLAHSARLGEKAKLLPEVFYGFLRQNLPTSLSALLAQSPEVQRSALETAIGSNIIPDTVRESLEPTFERLQRLTVEHAFEPAETYYLVDTGGVQLTLQLKELTQNHLGMVEKLKLNFELSISSSRSDR